MRDRCLRLIEQHCEKGALVIAGGWALWLAVAFLVQSPNRVALDGRYLSARELHEEILSKAEALERCIADASAPEVVVPHYAQQLQAAHRGGVLATADGSRGLLALPRLRLATAFGQGVDFPLERQTALPLVRPAAPPQPTIYTGHCVQAHAGADGSPDSEGSGSIEVEWARIMTRFDREQEGVALLNAGYPEYAANVYLVAVDAQRQEMLPDGGFTPWVTVKSAGESLAEALPTPAFDDQTGRLLNRDALKAAFTEVKAAQERAGRPSFGEILTGDEPPMSVIGETPDSEPVPNADPALIWVDDAGAKPGKYYRYRVRVRLWNRFVGRPAMLVRATDAERTVVDGEWSEASEPIKVAPRSHFFVLGKCLNEPAANVEVWKWYRGLWLRQRFTVAVGDAIGAARTVRLPEPDEYGRAVRATVDFGTGSTLIGMREEVVSVRTAYGRNGRFRWVQRPSLVAVCLDGASGSVEERSQVTDRAADLRKRLRRP
jgi:hypothetical protein